MGRDRSRSPRRGARDDDEEDLPAEGKRLELQFSLVFSISKLTVLVKVSSQNTAARRNSLDEGMVNIAQHTGHGPPYRGSRHP